MCNSLTDNIKAVNERLISDDRLTNNARGIIIAETFKEINSSFEAQIKLFNAFPPRELVFKGLEGLLTSRCLYTLRGTWPRRIFE